MCRLNYVMVFLISAFLISCDKGNEPGNENPTIKQLDVSDVVRFEGNGGNFLFTLNARLSETSDADVSFDYTTEDFSAKAGEDYISAQGSVMIPAGQRNAVFTIEVVGDTLREEDEVFYIVLSNVKNAAAVREKISVTLRNDDTFVEETEDGFISPDNYAGFDKVWADEFDGTNIDLSAWTHELGASGWGNNELQNYTASPQNSYLNQGKLVIEARKENNGQYTSARMITKGKKEFLFGRIDIRAKLPKGRGIWPALWMLGSNIQQVGWPACGEIDIMEVVGHEPNKLHCTAHWGNQGQSFSINSSKSITLDSGDFSDKFHVFSIIWENNRINWYLDNKLVHTITPANTAGYSYPFNQDFFFIFNIAVGGNWPGNPDASTQFPQRMTVDYIRVFQKK